MDPADPRTGERAEGGGNRTGGDEEGVGGECEESEVAATTAKGSLRSTICDLCLFIGYPIGRKENSPLEKVKNLLEQTTTGTAQATPLQQGRRKLEP